LALLLGSLSWHLSVGGPQLTPTLLKLVINLKILQELILNEKSKKTFLNKNKTLALITKNIF
jgi:hypothetical protein